MLPHRARQPGPTGGYIAGLPGQGALPGKQGTSGHAYETGGQEAGGGAQATGSRAGGHAAVLHFVTGLGQYIGGGGHGGGAIGGGQGGGRNAGAKTGGGARRPPMIAAGSPRQDPQMVEQIPRIAAHGPNTGGEPQAGGGHAGGAHRLGGGQTGGPPAAAGVVSSPGIASERHKRRAKTLSTIPHPPLVQILQKMLEGVVSSEGH